MWNLQGEMARYVHDFVSEEKYVEINGAWAFVYQFDTTQSLLNILQHLEEFERIFYLRMDLLTKSSLKGILIGPE
jgi:hypothetical protein